MKISVLFVVALAVCGTPVSAHPLDPPGTIYIDGVPCNRACQAYMRWSQRTLEGSVPVPSAPMSDAMKPSYRPSEDEPAGHTIRRKFHPYDANPAVARQQHSPSAAERHGPISGQRSTERSTRTNTAPSTSTAKSLDRTSAALRMTKPAGNTPGQTVALSNQPAASPNTLHVNSAASNIKPNQAETSSNRDDGSALAVPSPLSSNPTLARAEPDSESRPAAQVTIGSSPKALEHQIQAAADVAERYTLNAMDHVQTTKQTTSQDPTSYQTDGEDKFRLVALLLARGDIKSAADLAGKDIAIDSHHLGSNHDIQAALVAAGALKARTLDEGDHAIRQLVEGRVHAVVLTLVSREAVGVFPTVRGFRLLTIPLPARSE